MNDLEQFLNNNQNGREICKFKHYLTVYDRHLTRFRNKPITVVEIGVGHGGSLQMWKSYFGKEAKIYGVDKNDVREVEEDQIKILVGKQEDTNFLDELIKTTGPIDVLIDDGGHEPFEQKTTFDYLWKHIAPNGIYICEDTFHSYSDTPQHPGSFVEYSKFLADYVNDAYWNNSNKKEEFCSVSGLSFYLNLVIIEKWILDYAGGKRIGSVLLKDTPPYRIKPNGERETI